MVLVTAAVISTVTQQLAELELVFAVISATNLGIRMNSFRSEVNVTHASNFVSTDRHTIQVFQPEEGMEGDSNMPETRKFFEFYYTF